jgi:hypothetical protein
MSHISLSERILNLNSVDPVPDPVSGTITFKFALGDTVYMVPEEDNQLLTDTVIELKHENNLNTYTLSSGETRDESELLTCAEAIAELDGRI